MTVAFGTPPEKEHKLLVYLSFSVVSIFTNIDEKLFKKQQHIPDQKVIRTPYGGRLVITMPHGNDIVVHFKDKELIRHKKRWSQVGKYRPTDPRMYLFDARQCLNTSVVRNVHFVNCHFLFLQVMYLYYLLGWKVMTKYFVRWQKGGNEKELKAEVQVR